MIIVHCPQYGPASTAIKLANAIFGTPLRRPPFFGPQPVLRRRAKNPLHYVEIQVILGKMGALFAEMFGILGAVSRHSGGVYFLYDPYLIPESGVEFVEKMRAERNRCARAEKTTKGQPLSLQLESKFDQEIGCGHEVVKHDVDVLHPPDRHVFLADEARFEPRRPVPERTRSSRGICFEPEECDINQTGAHATATPHTQSLHASRVAPSHSQVLALTSSKVSRIRCPGSRAR